MNNARNSDDPAKNPLTNKKINPQAKTGVYQQLLKSCKKLENTNTNTNTKTSDNRTKLINAIKKSIEPLLENKNTGKARIKFFIIMQKYLQDIEPCLHIINKKLALFKRSDPTNPVVFFEKRIGSDSKFGVVYMNMGKGLARFLKFSSKLLSESQLDHHIEVAIYEKMTYYVANDLFPNMPLTYKHLLCKNIPDCKDPICPEQLKKKYFVVINELADCDIQTWFKTKHKDEEYISVLVQMIFAIYAFHGLGVLHNDLHLGNFLIHKVKPGGYWRYQFEDTEIYIPNTGYLLVIWDAGNVTSYGDPYNEKTWKNDYNKPMHLIMSLGTGQYQLYEKLQLKALPESVLDEFIVQPLKYLNNENAERNFMRKFISNIADISNSPIQIITDEDIDNGIIPRGYLLNVKPYFLDATILVEFNTYVYHYKLSINDICSQKKGTTGYKNCLFNSSKMDLPEGKDLFRFKMLEDANLDMTSIANLRRSFVTFWNFEKLTRHQPKLEWYTLYPEE
jgi:thiamine kinase-like enzyme